MIEALIHFAAVVAGYVAGLWVARGQERQRAADIVAELTRGWETLAEEQVKTIAALEEAVKAWKDVAEGRKRMIEELTDDQS